MKLIKDHHPIKAIQSTLILSLQLLHTTYHHQSTSLLIWRKAKHFTFIKNYRYSNCSGWSGQAVRCGVTILCVEVSKSKQKLKMFTVSSSGVEDTIGGSKISKPLPSSPRQFFQRLYGHLENKTETSDCDKSKNMCDTNSDSDSKHDHCGYLDLKSTYSADSPSVIHKVYDNPFSVGLNAFCEYDFRF